MDSKEMGRLGGLARAAKLSTERRLEIARAANIKRWKSKHSLVGPVEPVQSFKRCQAPNCNEYGEETIINGNKAWLCPKHAKE